MPAHSQIDHYPDPDKARYSQQLVGRGRQASFNRVVVCIDNGKRYTPTRTLRAQQPSFLRTKTSKRLLYFFTLSVGSVKVTCKTTCKSLQVEEWDGWNWTVVFLYAMPRFVEPSILTGTSIVDRIRGKAGVTAFIDK